MFIQQSLQVVAVDNYSPVARQQVCVKHGNKITNIMGTTQRNISLLRDVHKPWTSKFSRNQYTAEPLSSSSHSPRAPTWVVSNFGTESKTPTS